jgi:hypothetical protein
MLAGQQTPVDVPQNGLPIQDHVYVFQLDQRECHFEWQKENAVRRRRPRWTAC